LGCCGENVAIPQATGDYILLLNPDTEVLDDAIQKTVAFMEIILNAGIAGCKLLFPDGSVQKSVRGFHCPVYVLKRLFSICCCPRLDDESDRNFPLLLFTGG